MKPKLYLLALTLICGLLPLTSQGAELLDRVEPGPKPRSARMQPVLLDVETGALTVMFIQDLGEVAIILQEEVTGKIAVNRIIDAAAGSSVSFSVPNGAYTLTVTDAFGNLISVFSIEIP